MAIQMDVDERTPSANERKLTMMIVSHTHWDREWYRPYQEFRFALVELVDQLLDLLATDEGYKYFTLDGQTVVLEDYLELRPERRGELARHIASGRVLVGPWYVLPDEFLVSGESLVRNLLVGRRIASAFGVPMPVGYIPDPFGHVAQLPQILRGFGIRFAAMWRGLGRDLKSCEFWWAGLDGVPIMALHLATGYANATELPNDPAQLCRRLQRIREGLQPLATTPYLVLMNGHDHALPQAELSRIIEMAKSCLPGVDIEHATLPMVMQRLARHANGSWPTITGELRSPERAPLLPGVLSTRMWIKQRNATCEARLEKWAEPFSAWAHVVLHQPAQTEMLRYAWQHLLVNHAHDSICGCSVDQVHREMSPRFDQVEQLAERITEKALVTLAHQVRTREDGFADHSGPEVVVYNPLSWPRPGAVTITAPADLTAGVMDQARHYLPAQILGPEREEVWELDQSPMDILSLLERATAGNPREWNEESFRRLEAWLCGLFGDRMEGGRISAIGIDEALDSGNFRVLVDLGHCPRGAAEELALSLCRLADIAADEETRLVRLRVRRREVDLCFAPPAVSPCGYSSYHLLAQRAEHTDVPAGRVRAFENVLENDQLTVEVEPDDGTITIFDRIRGQSYRGLNRLVDGGDAGDEYNYCPPARDRFIYHPKMRPTVTVEESGPVRASMRIDALFALPSELSEDRTARSHRGAACLVSTTISLSAGSPWLEIRTELDNASKDHRLRVHFPSGCHSDAAVVGGQFGVLERAHGVPVADKSWKEMPIATRPHSGFVGVASEGRGLVVSSRGLPEYEVLQTEDGDEIALTLLRSVGWLSRDDLSVRLGHAGPGFATPEAQCLGRHVFEYAVTPHQGDWRFLVREVDNYLHPLRAQLTPGRHGSLPAQASFLSLEPAPLLMSAVKVAEDGRGLVVRFYNPLPQPVTATLTVGPSCSAVERVDLAEQSIGALDLHGQEVQIHTGPAEIVSVRLVFPRSAA